MFDVALATGLRLGELRALRWCDVDFERSLIRVEQAYSRATLKRPKTDAGIRSVPLFASAEAAMRELAARAFARGRFADNELVFATGRGTPLDGSNFNSLVWSKTLQGHVRQGGV
ncbi:MAG: tyrosine-type recombinase/integrase [Gaiellaceae bacterium]